MQRYGKGTFSTNLGELAKGGQMVALMLRSALSTASGFANAVSVINNTLLVAPAVGFCLLPFRADNVASLILADGAFSFSFPRST